MASWYASKRDNDACGVTGNSKDIEDYLQSHCDSHPLVAGVLAGLVTG
jgi:hypothetical protein